MTQETNAFADRWARLSLLVPVAMMAVSMALLSFERTIWSGAYTLTDDQERVSPPFEVPVTAVGGLRIDGRAQLLANRWVAYQVTLLDAADDEPLLELTKEAWSETGRWYEDGESGAWAEADTELAWDLRPRQTEKVKLQLAVLETGYADGAPVPTNLGAASGSSDAPGGEAVKTGFSVPLQVTVRAGVVDGRLLALGLALSLSFSLLAYYLAGHGGRAVIVERNDDSAVKGRAVFGGRGRLVALALAGTVDETTHPQVNLRLWLRDESGVDVYHRKLQLPVTLFTDDGKVEGGRFGLRLYFELPRVTSWGVFVDITPDAPMESLKLIVRDGASTRGAVALESLLEPRGVGAPGAPA